MEEEEESETERRRWDEACRREATVRELLLRHPDRLTVKSVEHAAWELGVSRATVYRLIHRYRAKRAVSGLLPGKRGRPLGFRTLTPEQEAVIRQAVEREYLRPTRPPLRHLVEQVGHRFRQKGWAAPTWRTVKSRVLEIDQRLRGRAKRFR